MEFCKLLNELMERHNVRAVDICTKLDLKKSYFSRIRSGELLPSDYQIVYEMSKILHLTEEESDSLTLAYQSAKTDTKYSRASKAFNRLYAISIPTSCDTCDDVELSNGQVLSGEEAVTEALLKVSASAESTLKLYYKPEHNELLRAFSGLSLSTETRFEWLIPLEKTSGSSEHNMDSFVNAIMVLLNKKAEIKGQYVHIGESIESSVFSYYAVTEKEVLLFNRGCQNALYLSSAEAVELYSNGFDTVFSSSVSFMKLFDDVGEFFSEYDSLMHFDSTAPNTDIYVIEKYPCITLDVNLSAIRSHVSDELDSNVVAAAYADLLQKGYTNVRRICSIFSESGLYEFIEAEEYYEMGKFLSKPLSRAFRMDTIKHMMSYSRGNESLDPMLIRLPTIAAANVRLINFWSDGKMIVMFNFSDRFSIVLLNENSIVKAFLNYFKMLIKCGLICSKEETLERMTRVIDEHNEQK